ncbi:DUF4129 domain-containing protein [Microbacterium sp. NPDC091313]
MIPAVPASLLAAAPLLPSPDEAQEWARRELADPVYAAAEPTLLDRISQAVGEALFRLLNPDLSGGWGPVAAVVATVAVIAVLVVSILVWGRPRSRARVSTADVALFGADAARTAAQLRADAESDARRGAWDTAVVLRFRAIAQTCLERALLSATPGTTAQSFARDAARVFPAHHARLRAAASGFDDVRYLRRPATEALYRDIARLDDDLAAERPALAAVPA